MSDRPLTDKQARFVQEYLVDLNATQAAIRAGYSVNTAQRIGSENLSKPVIARHIEQLQASRANDTAWNATKVRERLEAMADLDVGDILTDDGTMLPVKQWPKIWRMSISGLELVEMMSGDILSVLKKVKWPDRLRNLELLGKHVDIRAFGERADSDEDNLAEPKTVIYNVAEPVAEVKVTNAASDA